MKNGHFLLAIRLQMNQQKGKNRKQMLLWKQGRGTTSQDGQAWNQSVLATALFIQCESTELRKNFQGAGLGLLSF